MRTGIPSAAADRGRAHGRLRADMRALLGALGFLPLLVLSWYFWSSHPGLPADAQTYLAAGERLNAGHPLYGPLVASDRAVIDATHFAAPLLSPPLVAVLWRPLATLGEWTVYAWWAAAVLALVGTLLFLWGRAPLTTGILVAVTSYALAIELGVANLDSFIVAGLVAAWWLWRGGHVSAAMWIAVFLAGLKLVPAFLVVWLLAVAPRKAWRPFLAATALFAGLSIAGAGLDAHLDYLRVLSSTADGSGSLPLVAVAFAAAIIAARRRPVAAYCLASVAMVAVWNPLAPLMALAAPVAWPRSDLWPVATGTGTGRVVVVISAAGRTVDPSASPDAAGLPIPRTERRPTSGAGDEGKGSDDDKDTSSRMARRG